MRMRRTKLRIYLDVLRLIRDGTEKPTLIMYRANISWKPLQHILSSLLSLNMIREIEVIGTGRRTGRDTRTKKLYEITEKGEKAIEYFECAKDFLILAGEDYLIG
jgi:predicted transcriptional regulator